MKNITKQIAVAVAIVGLAGSAYAVPTLRLTAGATVITIVDGGGSDSSATAGSVVYVGSVGAEWTVNITTGTTKPLQGSAGVPFIAIDTSSTSRSAGIPDSLKIEFSETGFSATTGGYLIKYGGTVATGGSLDSFAYADTTDTLFGTGTALGSLLGSSGAYSSTGGAATPGTAPYSLTLVMVLTHATGANTSTPGITLSTVPDGGSTLMLLGSALTAVGFLNRKRIANRR